MAMNSDIADAGTEKLRKQYLDFLWVKRKEIDEARQSRRYYHADQWTSEELEKLKKRRQPPIFDNRIQRKIDAVVGLLARLKQDPKAYPRTPQHEQGADVATAVLRYGLDVNRWDDIESECGRYAAVSGLAGVEFNLIAGDQGDPEVEILAVEPDLFFYDPRSFRADFLDARYMGVAKWVDLEQAQEMFPDFADELAGLVERDADLAGDQDREEKWVDTDRKRIRLVDHWYMSGGVWNYCVYASTLKLADGVSPYKDERGKSLCKFVMFSGGVDHEGDRYGFVRNLKPLQDEVNSRRSKAMHFAFSRRAIIRKGSHSDIEKLRQEASRPDGVIEYDAEKPEFDDARTMADMAAQFQFLQESKDAIENFGPNPALVGQGGVENSSGRAIALLQQAGIAELGPFLQAYKGWKIRVYRALWNIVKSTWTSQRWIRVTDDEQVAQFLQVNELRIDPMSGMPQIVNALGSLDVDIIIDEGPDTVNMMADIFETLSVLAQRGQQIPPGLLIEVSPLPSNIKQKYLAQIEAAQQPDPMAEQGKQIALQSEAAKVAETKARTLKTATEAMKNSRDAMMPDMASSFGPRPMDGGLAAVRGY